MESVTLCAWEADEVTTSDVEMVSVRLREAVADRLSVSERLTESVVERG
jgi:hypothetical protein